jgi:hypothetical protein
MQDWSSVGGTAAAMTGAAFVVRAAAGLTEVNA